MAPTDTGFNLTSLNQTVVVEAEIVTGIEFHPTELRTNSYYVLFYVNIARLIITGILPFVLLAWLNGAIYR